MDDGYVFVAANGEEHPYELEVDDERRQEQTELYSDEHEHEHEHERRGFQNVDVDSAAYDIHHHHHPDVYDDDDDDKHRVDSSSGKLFVGGIAWETTEESFSSYFGKYGEITDSVIMMDKMSGRPRGFGFVTFADSAVADTVLEENHVIDGRAVEVKRTVPREEMQGKGLSKTRKIFVGGIPVSLTEDELREYFLSYGRIVEHQILLDHKTGRSRGFGFVTFENEDAVDEIFADGQRHEIGGKQVEIKRAEPKRASSDYATDSRQRHGGGSSKSYGAGFGTGGAGYGGAYGGKMGRGYGAYAGYGGYTGYGGYGGYGGNYAGGTEGYYSGYGGYGYGFAFGGPMYSGAAYGGSSYGAPGSYGGAAGYGGGKGYGSAGGAAAAAAAAYMYGGSRGYGGSGGGAYGGSKGYGNSGAATGRYHPYRK